jgi:predicted AAA+ superfamily ATPase
MQPTSYRRLANLLTSTGIKVAVSTVSDYVRFAKEAFAIFSLDNYASKFVEKETVKKHYFVDNGLLSIFLNNGSTLLLENLCAIYLYEKYEDKLYYYNKNIEVDFFVPDEAYAIQVAYSIYGEGMTNTYDREVKALQQLDRFFPLQRMVIVTFDEEDIIEIAEGKQIEVIPAWKWLLETVPL